MGQITHCICRATSFSEIQRLAAEQGLLSLGKACSLDDIVDKLKAGDKCGLCRPYLARMLETGETEFEQ